MMFQDKTWNFKQISYEVAKPAILEDGSLNVTLQHDGFIYSNNWRMGHQNRSFGGNEVVRGMGKEWRMRYLGQIISKKMDGREIDEAYMFLRESLSESTADFPFRGPEKYQASHLLYTNSVEGNFSKFSRGIERIFINGEEVYQLIYEGGFSPNSLSLSPSNSQVAANASQLSLTPSAQS